MSTEWAGSDQTFQIAAQRRFGGFCVGLCLVSLEVLPVGERIIVATTTRAHTHSDSPEGIGDNMELIPGAIAVLLVVGDDGGAGVVLAVGSQSCSMTRCARFFLMCL